MANGVYDIRKAARERQSQTRKETWEEQKPEILKEAQQAQQRKNVMDLLARNMDSGAPSARDRREMRLTEAKRQEELAKQRYEDYKQSEQRDEDWKNTLHEAVMGINWGSGNADLQIEQLPQKTIPDAEKAHAAAQNYFTQNREATQERFQMEDDLAELAKWSKEDQQVLAEYELGRYAEAGAPTETFSLMQRQNQDKFRYLADKYGEDTVKRLAESWYIKQTLDASQMVTDAAVEHTSGGLGGKVAANAGSVAANAVGVLTNPLGYLVEAGGRTGRYKSLNANNPGALPGLYASTVIAETAKDIEGEDPGVGRKLLSLGYQGGMVAADQLLRLAMGGGTKFGTLGLAALGSFGSTLSEASAQGATPGQAVLKGVASAGIEVATEKVPLDELFRAGKSGFQGAKAAFRQALKQGGIEAAEEEISLLGNVLVDALVMREKSSYNQQIGELVANGMSYADAKAQADRQLWDEAVNTAVTSFVSGNVMSGAQSGGQYIGQRIQERNATQNATAPQNATASKTEAVGDNLKATVEDSTVVPRAKPTAQDAIAALEQGRAQTPADDGSQEVINELVGADQAQVSGVQMPIQKDMPEQARYEALKDKKVVAVTDTDSANYPQEMKSLDALKAKAKSQAEKIIKPLAKKLGILNRSMKTPDLEVEFQFSGGGLNESMAKQLHYGGSYADFGRAMVNLDKVLKNAVLVEQHGDKYKGTIRENRNLENVSVLFGAFRDGDSIIPMQMEIKKASDTGSRLYMTVTMTKIEADVKGKTVDPGQAPSLLSASEYNIADVFGKINPQDAHFLKYVPDGFLTAEQASAKRQALAKDAAKIQRYRETGRRGDGRNDPQGAAEGVADDVYKSVGAAGQQFKHEVRKSKVYENTYKNATDPEVKSAGEKAMELDPGIGEYDYVSEEESMYHAKQRLESPDGLEAELEYLTNKQGWTGEDNDTAMMILKQLQKGGDVAAFKALARAQREQGTSQGQFIQSFAKYSRDATGAAVDAVEMLDKLSKGDVPKKFWKKNDFFDAWKDDMVKSVLEIANDIEAVKDGDAESMRNIVRQLANFRKTTAFFGMKSELTKIAERILKKMDFGTAKDIACAQLAKIPDDFRSRSKGEVIKAIRYQNMLSSLVTVGRNLVGNGTMGMVDAFSDATAGRFADLLLSKATGKRTVGNDIRYAKEYLNAARDAAGMASLLAELDIPAEHEGKYTGRTRTFSPQGGPLSRFLSAYEKYMNYALQVSDEFFSGGTAGAVSKSLEALGAKSGLTGEEIAALGDRIGRRRTFKEGRRLARASGKMKDALNVLGTEDFGTGDMLLAFAETPAEMGQAAIDYSGTGILEGFAEMASIIKDARNGKNIDAERQRKAVSNFGRGVTGVGMIALFTALAAKGLIVVHDDEDKDKRGLEQSLGLSGAQFNIDATIRAMRGESTEWQDDDLVMSIDFLQPFNSQMYIGYLLSQEEEAGLKAYAGASVQGIAQSVLDIPMMGTIEDIADLLSSFGEVSEGDYSAVTDAAGQLIGNQASSFVPAWMRQTAQYIDPVYRDTTGENTLDAAKNRVVSGIPLLSQKLPAKYDGLGNLQTRYDNKLLGFFNTFLNPGALKRIQASDIADKLEQLGDKSVYPEYLAPKSFQVDGETVMVSGKEMTEAYQKTYGDNVAALYGGLMDNEDFQKLSSEQQTEALKLAKSYATQFAKAAVSDYKDTPEGTSSELVQDIIRKQAGAGIEDVLGDITQAWKDGQNLPQEARMGFTNAVLAYDRMSSATKSALAESADGALKLYLDAKESGIGAADFLNLYEASVKTGSYRNFDLVTEGKMDVSAANDIMWMLEGITGTGKENAETGERAIRDIDRVQAIADGKGISDKETETAIRLLILDEKQEEKLDNVLDLGYDIDEYADFYQVQVDNSKKADFIAAIKAMGLSNAAATALYHAFNPKK